MSKAISDEIIQCTILLHKYLSDFLILRCPQARATAMFFFKKAYRKQKLNDIQLLHFQIASLYLSTKVYEKQFPIIKFMEGLTKAKQDKELVCAIPILKEIATDDPEYVHQLTKHFIEAEKDIIFDLDFRFSIPLPYDCVIYLVNCIAHWHILRQSPIYHDFILEIRDKSCRFLNDLQSSPLFYQYPPDIVAQASIRLTFEKLNLPLENPGQLNWYAILLPFKDIQQIDEAYSKIREYFLIANFMSKIKPQTKINENDLKDFIYFPLVDVDVAENMCPPPPLDLLKEIAGEEDTFTNLWNEHTPMCPPPPLELLDNELGSVISAKQRTRSEDSLNFLLETDIKNEIQKETTNNVKPINKTIDNVKHTNETNHRYINKFNPNTKQRNNYNNYNRNNKYGQRNNNYYEPKGNYNNYYNYPPKDYPRNDYDRDIKPRQQRYYGYSEFPHSYQRNDGPDDYNQRYDNSYHSNGIYKMDRNYGPPRYENKNNYTNFNDRRVNRREFDRNSSRNDPYGRY